ncbi:MAG: ABC transporter permease [Bacteroidales bacterium]|nr:ABC transporter permease [Bacteroidales bacterium]
MYSIFYKEWIKTRRLIFLLLPVFAAMIIYILLNVGKQYRLGPVPLWESLIQNNAILVGYFKYLPLAAGILMAIVQFVPEMQHKRLKLTLHLPVNESKILSNMLGYGIIILAALFILSEVVLLSGLGIRFCPELVMANFKASLPWFIGGLASYLLAAWICLEPVWRQRIFNAVIAACCISFFYNTALPGAYAPFLPYLICFIVVSFLFSFYAAARFKDGEQ